ncbi:hypothetical protein ACLB1Q_01695 [Escherichia coli]
MALDPFELVLDRARNGENIVSEIKSLYVVNAKIIGRFSPFLISAAIDVCPLAAILAHH